MCLIIAIRHAAKVKNEKGSRELTKMRLVSVLAKAGIMEGVRKK